VKPRIEPLGVAERGQITPGPYERILDGVGGLFGIPKDQPGGGIQTGDRGAGKLGEGVMIAPPRSLHEVSLHHALGVRHGRPATLGEYGESSPPNGSQNPNERSLTRYHRRPAAAPDRSLPRVKIQEADAKSLLLAQGLPVPPWEVAHTPAEVRAAAERFFGEGAKQVVI
jgi:hypothetical protein